jgi:hypothetical protein
MFCRCAMAVSTLALALFLSPCLAEEDKGDKQARETAEQFIKLFKAKDLEGLMKLVATPFCTGRQEIVEDKNELKKVWKKNLANTDVEKVKITIEKVGTLEKLEEATGKKMKEEKRNMLVKVLGKDHRLVLIEIDDGERVKKSALAVRLDGGKASIVGIVD